MPRFHPEYERLSQARLLETVVTTSDELGVTNVAAMGPRVSDDFRWLLLRPFNGSATFRNLRGAKKGVMHITDDVALLVRAALDCSTTRLPDLTRLDNSETYRLTDCCRWYSFEVDAIDSSRDRCEMVCRVIEAGCVRDFIGWNRAQFAVIEAAIIASRWHLMERDEIDQSLQRLSIIVDKTAGPREREAFALARQWIGQKNEPGSDQ